MVVRGSLAFRFQNWSQLWQGYFAHHFFSSAHFPHFFREGILVRCLRLSGYLFRIREATVGSSHLKSVNSDRDRADWPSFRTPAWPQCKRPQHGVEFAEQVRYDQTAIRTACTTSNFELLIFNCKPFFRAFSNQISDLELRKQLRAQIELCSPENAFLILRNSFYRVTHQF